MAYNEKYRRRAVENRKKGHTIEETAKVFKIGATAFKRWTKKHEETGEMSDKELKRTFKKVDHVKLEEYLELHPEAYLAEIANNFRVVKRRNEKH